MKTDFLSDDVKRVISALAKSEDALSLMDFVRMTSFPVEEVSEIVDFLVTIGIFTTDNSFCNSDVGDIVYSFAENEMAQMVAKAFEEEIK